MYIANTCPIFLNLELRRWHNSIKQNLMKNVQITIQWPGSYLLLCSQDQLYSQEQQMENFLDPGEKPVLGTHLSNYLRTWKCWEQKHQRPIRNSRHLGKMPLPMTEIVLVLQCPKSKIQKIHNKVHLWHCPSARGLLTSPFKLSSYNSSKQLSSSYNSKFARISHTFQQ